MLLCLESSFFHDLSMLKAATWKVIHSVIITIVFQNLTSNILCFLTRTEAAVFRAAVMATAMLHREYYASKSWICSTNPNHLQTQRTRPCLHTNSITGVLYSPSSSFWCDLKTVCIGMCATLTNTCCNGFTLCLWLFIDSSKQKDYVKRNSKTVAFTMHSHNDTGSSDWRKWEKYSK